MIKVERVLWPTDFSEASRASLDHAAHWAKAFDAELHLLHIDLPGSEPATEGDEKFPADSEVRAALDAEPGELLERLEATAWANEPPRLERVIRSGFQPVPPILDYIEEAAIDLVVMSTHGRGGLARLFLGSTAEELVRSVTCPIVTVRTGVEPIGKENRILLPVDLSSVTEALLETAREISSWTGAKIDVLHILEPRSDWSIHLGGPRTWPTKAELVAEAQRRIAELVDNAGIDPHLVAVTIDNGFTGEQILERAIETEPDLVLIASHSQGLSRVLLGSTAERVVNRCQVPVLTLPRGLLKTREEVESKDEA